jgi:hypothetical protein
VIDLFADAPVGNIPKGGSATYWAMAFDSHSHGPAVCDHPTVQVFLSFEADGNDAAISVEIARLAAHRGKANPIGQRKGCSLSATPAFAHGSHAELAAFGGVDTKQGNTLAMDFDRVAVDCGGDADDAILRNRTR